MAKNDYVLVSIQTSKVVLLAKMLKIIFLLLLKTFLKDYTVPNFIFKLLVSYQKYGKIILNNT